MSPSAALLAATLGLPALMLAACISARARAAMPAWLWLAPLPGLLASFLAVDGAPLTLALPRLEVTFALDLPGAILLGVAATLWIAAGAYGRTYLRGTPHAGRFAEFWLMTLTGSLGVFVAADLASFYTLFALASLAACGLVLHDGTDRARRAGIVYLEFAIAGEVFLLMGFVLLATALPADDLLIEHAVAALPGSPWSAATMLLLVAGFGLKAGLVPLHAWLPVAHPAAPMPASAVLSGAIIKAGVIGLIRFLPLGAALPGWGEALTALGLATAFYGVGVGVTQANPKTVLAYSSISQMGLVAAALGMGLAAGDGQAATLAACLAAHHVLAKGALFLAVGVAAATGRGRLWTVLLPAAVLGLGMGGLPLTGGALAKLAVKPALGDGIVGGLAALAAAGTTLLMMHFLHRLASTAAGGRAARAPGGLVLPWLALAAAALLVPWALYPPATGQGLAAALAAGTIRASLWPVALGAALFLALRRWGRHLPRLPEGDILVLGGSASRLALAGAGAIERAERLLRPWPSLGLALLALTLALGLALMPLG